MRACGRYLWHIHVIHKDQQSLPHRRPVSLFGPFLDIGLQVPLQVHWSRSGWEVNHQSNLETKGKQFSLKWRNKCPHAWLDRKLTILSASRFFKKLWTVAVLEVPESPTRSTGLFIFTICSRIQLALVVSIVGTRWRMNESKFKKELGRAKKF